MPVSDILARVRASGTVTAGHAVEARRAVYGHDGTIDGGEIEGLFAIDEAAVSADPAWSVFLVEAGTDYVVHQRQPEGYVDEAKADWLIDRIGKDGKVKTATELALLVKVLEAAKSSPEKLVSFALRQVESAVVDGTGPLADGGELQPGRVGRAETDLVRRILYAFGGDGGVAITRAEAAVLFDINDKTVDADNDPAWTDLFVKAIANSIMAGFFSRMVAGGFRGVLQAYTSSEDESAAARKHL